jgi:hypothetical protein
LWVRFTLRSECVQHTKRSLQCVNGKVHTLVWKYTPMHNWMQSAKCPTTYISTQVQTSVICRIVAETDLSDNARNERG